MFRRVTLAGAGLLGIAALVAGVIALERSPAPTKPAAAASSSRPAAQGTAGSQGSSRSPTGVGLALAWKVLGSTTAHTIQNAYLPAQAHGVFLILTVRESNPAQQPFSLRQDPLTLRLGGASYSVDQAAESALELEGHASLPLDQLAADATATGWVAFDVAPSALAPPIKLCAGQAGCVAVPLPPSSAT